MSGGTIKLKMSSTQDDSLNYELNGIPYTMNPGYSQTILLLIVAGQSHSMMPPAISNGRLWRQATTRFVKNNEGRWELRQS